MAQLIAPTIKALQSLLNDSDAMQAKYELCHAAAEIMPLFMGHKYLETYCVQTSNSQ